MNKLEKKKVFVQYHASFCGKIQKIHISDIFQRKIRIQGEKSFFFNSASLLPRHIKKVPLHFRISKQPPNFSQHILITSLRVHKNVLIRSKSFSNMIEVIEIDCQSPVLSDSTVQVSRTRSLWENYNANPTPPPTTETQCPRNFSCN